MEAGEGASASLARRLMIKRLFDLSVAFVALTLLAPVMAIVVLAVRVALGSPILLRQNRPGKHGHPFAFYKFRSMTEERDTNGELLPDEQRLTPFGRWLRQSSLDELPQLLNVLKGDMSLVGPRPLLMEYLPLYTASQARRHEVRPGITGWAQVNGRNAVGWDERFAMDTWYVDHHSFWLDLRILAMTVRNVIARKGIQQGGHATMPKFRGSGKTDDC